MSEIELLNEWLEQKAVKEDQSPNRSSKWWSEYYRGLKNLNTLDKFMVISFDIFSTTYGYPPYEKTPMGTYLETHENEYDLFPTSGSFRYVRKK